MKAICTDGTIVECDRFRAIDEGVLLFDDPEEIEEEGGEDVEISEEAAGFIPLRELLYVLPDRVELGGPQAQPQPMQQQQQMQPPSQPPQQSPPPR